MTVPFHIPISDEQSSCCSASLLASAAVSILNFGHSNRHVVDLTVVSTRTLSVDSITIKSEGSDSGTLDRRNN